MTTHADISRPATTRESLATRLADLARNDPDRPAVTCGQDSLTRQELDRRTNRLARAYRELGVTKDSFVTIALPNGVEFVTAAIAAWKCGATPQPISSRLPGREATAIIELASPSLVVGMAPSDVPGFPVVPAGFQPGPDVSDGPFDEGISAAFKAPTSGGSTGRPKLIVSTEPATTQTLDNFAALVGIEPGDTVLNCGPLYHNAGFTMTSCGLAQGAHVVLMPKFDAVEALRLVAQHGVNWMFVVPTMMSRIWRLDEAERLEYDVSSLRVVMHMAAPCPEWLKRAWIDWLGPDRIWELYAGTEVQAVTIAKGSEWLDHPGTVGRPVAGEIAILDPGAPVAAGDIGEIWMRRGEGIPNPYRYIGAEAQRRGGGWETIGDLGWMDSDGYVYLADRKSDMILVGGANVYPAEVEGVLLEHPHVVSAVVIGLPDNDLGQIPHALVEVSDTVSDDELRAHVLDRIAAYKAPRTFERVDGSVRDDAGKVRRSALVAERTAPTD